jgi:hypothetical protein
MQPDDARPGELAEGDRVQLRKDGPGTVIAVIRDAPASDAAALDPWRRLGRGIVVRLDSGTLVHIREPSFELVPDAPPTEPQRN